MKVRASSSHDAAGETDIERSIPRNPPDFPTPCQFHPSLASVSLNRLAFKPETQQLTAKAGEPRQKARKSLIL
jgi:hypothetical protein